MKIYLTSGTANGPTPLAAFDAALLAAGVGNYNLLKLSSVIPAGSILEEVDKYCEPEEEYGQRLYVVISQKIETKPGHEAWAGLGWAQEKSGKGLFVEIHGASESEVKENIQKTLRAMKANRPIDYGPTYEKLAGIKCVDQPVCALAVAIFESQEW